MTQPYWHPGQSTFLNKNVHFFLLTESKKKPIGFVEGHLIKEVVYNSYIYYKNTTWVSVWSFFTPGYYFSFTLSQFVLRIEK